MQPGLFGSYRQAFLFVVAGCLATILILGTVGWLAVNTMRFADALIEGRAFPTIPHAEPVR